MKGIAIGLAIIIAIVAFVKVTNAHDAAVEAAYSKYEACVQAQYGVSPSTYYQQHGNTPPCN